LSGLNLGLAAFFLKESHSKLTKGEPFLWRKISPFGFIARLFQKSEFRPFLIIYALIIFAYTAYLTVFSFVTMEKFGWSPLDYGLCLMAYGIAGLIGQAFLIERAVKRLGLDRAIFYGAVTYAPQNQQGEIQGILGSASGLMLMIGPIMMAEFFTYTALSSWPVSSSLKTGSPFILGGVISLICLMLVVKYVKRQALRAQAPKPEV